LQTVDILLRNESNNPTPAYATVGSSGADIRAFLDNPITLKQGERILVPTGLFTQIPTGYEIQVRPRSGLAFKNGVTCLNTPGTIDADYRGEIKVLLINLGQEDFVINSGDRIAQLVVASVTKANYNLSDELNSSDRGAGGFGHTGIK
jgi:dUTP pyrophosphatase